MDVTHDKKYIYQKRWSFGREEPKKTVMEGVSGKIIDFFKCAEVPLSIRWTPLAESPKKKVKHATGRPRKVQPIVIAINSDSPSSD